MVLSIVSRRLTLTMENKMGTIPVILKVDSDGDLQCPHCGRMLMWDENRLYAFSYENVACQGCGEKFYAKQEVITKYLVKKND